MSNKPRIDQYPRSGSLTIADGQIYEIRRGGDFVRIKTASADIKLRIDNDQELTLSQNDVLRFQNAPFKGLEVINNSGGNLSFQIEVGEGGVETNNVSISGALDVSKSATLDTAADQSISSGGSPTSIAAANTARRELIVQNLDPANAVRIGDTNITATRGIKLDAGATFVLSTTAQVYAYHEAGAAVSLSVNELED